MNDSYSVEMRQIVKHFGTVVANDDVDFRAKPGQIHALLGENGAGKSTMMCMLSGVYRPTSGEIFIHGEQVKIRSPKDAMKLGVGMVLSKLPSRSKFNRRRKYRAWGEIVILAGSQMDEQ